MKFNELGLNQPLLDAVEALGFETPTLIQEKVIPLILNEEKDLVGLAQTGTGKTAAFGLPLLNKITPQEGFIKVVILCPTRELCIQIESDMKTFAVNIPKVRMLAVYGGTGYSDQTRALKRGVDIIIATPGRLLDLINKGYAKIDLIQYLVLDEADIMLNMGFKDELDSILGAASTERQSLLFSATMPPEVARIAKNYMTNPTEITAGTKNAGASTVSHYYYMVHARDKFAALKRLVDSNPGVYGIIFCRTRATTRDISEKLIKEGYNADALHGDLSQDQREHVMRKFRERSLEILVATDIAARGLDVKDLTHIFHFDLPDEIEIYNHRSGRTGRAGKEGRSLAIVNMKEHYKIRRIEGIIGRSFKEGQIPGGKDICEAQFLALIDRVKNVKVDQEHITRFLPVVEEKLGEFSKEDLLAHFLSLEFNRFLDYYKSTPDLGIVKKRSDNFRDRDGGRGQRGGRPPRDRRGRTEGGEYNWITVNLGRRDSVTPPEIMGIINREAGGNEIPLGKIEIEPAKTFIQVAVGSEEIVMDALKRKNVKGRRLRVEAGKKREGGGSSDSGGRSGYGGSRSGGSRSGGSRSSSSRSSSSRSSSSRSSSSRTGGSSRGGEGGYGKSSGGYSKSGDKRGGKPAAGKFGPKKSGYPKSKD